MLTNIVLPEILFWASAITVQFTCGEWKRSVDYLRIYSQSEDWLVILWPSYPANTGILPALLCKSKKNPLSLLEFSTLPLQQWSLRHFYINPWVFSHFYYSHHSNSGWKEKHNATLLLCHFSCSSLKNKELSPVIGQKGIQGVVTPSGQSQHSEHSPHSLRRGENQLNIH